MLLNVVLSRITDDNFDKNTAYSIECMDNNLLTVHANHKDVMLGLSDPDFIICFGITINELHNMGVIYVGETELKTSWVADTIKKAFEECIDSGYSCIDCGKCFMEAEYIDRRDEEDFDDYSYMEMRILDKDKKSCSNGLKIKVPIIYD